MTNRLPPPSPPYSENPSEALIINAAAKKAFNVRSSAAFSFMEDARKVFYKVELGISPAILRDYPGFKTLAEKCPASLAVTFISALQDGFLSLAKVENIDSAQKQLALMCGTVRCAIEAFEIINTQQTEFSENEEVFMRALSRRINLSAKSINLLRGFIQ